ncbi:MAG: asparagine synthase (glutamine-hydrolyzing) [Candidatus Limivivens sp.]|nr:asparagine synthase (glutamine-hydrolyzing) [Candidatus Limivivens sp.]
MCGFAGFVSVSGQRAPEEVLLRMTEKIAKRGPDDSGEYFDESAALGFRRLSIVGLGNGRQPMENETNDKVLVYNGEIYNYQELKEELEAKGHIFRTDTDSEVVLHGYEEFGEDVTNHLRGMFAFAIWDKKEKTLFLGRDVFGIKPLFYSIIGDTLVFASEIKAILEYPEYRKEFNEEALGYYLSFQFNPLEETFFKNIYQLMPAHSLKWDGKKAQTRRYWRVAYQPDEQMDEQQAMERLEQVMLDSVEKHELSDVEIGSFLSGGIDSSFLAAASQVPKTFSVGFEDSRYSEIDLAKRLCEEKGMENYSKTITDQEFWDAVPTVVYYLDEPVADPSIIPLYYLCQLASKYVKVVFSGEGSDEIFGGYNIYQTHYSLEPVQWIPFGLRKAVRKLMEALPFSFKGKEYLIRAGETVEERFIGNAYIYKPKEARKLLKNRQIPCDPQKVTAPFYDEVKDLDEVTKMQYIDMNFWLRGDILRKSDHMSMANSLEVRVPFLDRKVAEEAFRYPLRLRVTRHETKHLFRRMSEKYLPKENADRRKLGFPVPIRKWLREEPYYQKVLGVLTSPEGQKFFNQKELVGLMEAHRSGKKDNSRKIWTVYVFLVWYQANFA